MRFGLSHMPVKSLGLPNFPHALCTGGADAASQSRFRHGNWLVRIDGAVLRESST